MLVIGIILICYCSLILWLAFGFDKVTSFRLEDTHHTIPFSVVIPFRNEAKNLPGLLRSIQKLVYPGEAVEFLFVDDGSDDGSAAIIKEFFEISNFNNQQTRPGIRIINNRRISNSPKKDAIQTAITHATYEWIITTDADCILPELWLASYNTFIQKNDPVLVAGPVNYEAGNSFLQTFQKVEFHTLQATTIGSFGIGHPMMCNSANLAYKKVAFLAVNGYQGNNHIASGDDVFLFEKLYSLYGERVWFLKTKAAMVTTFPERTWNNFIAQRVRWVSKSTHYKHLFTKVAGSLILLGNLSLVVSSILALFQHFPLLVLLLAFFIKIMADIFLLLKFHHFFINRKPAKIPFSVGLAYPFISIFIAVSTVCSGYTWKGRFFQK